MKKIRRLNSVMLATLAFAGTFSSCTIKPTEVRAWYLSNYTVNGKTHYTYDDRFDYYGALSSDDVMLIFEDGKNFIFTLFDKQYSGTYIYKAKKGAKATEVTLLFEDGRIGIGDFGRYAFSEVAYTATFNIFDIRYEFIEYESGVFDRKANMNYESWLIEQICKNDEDIEDGGIPYLRGEMLKTEEGYLFTANQKADDGKLRQFTITSQSACFVYEYGESYDIAVGDRIKEGSCILKYEALEDKDEYRYAIYFYEEDSIQLDIIKE